MSCPDCYKGNVLPGTPAHNRLGEYDDAYYAPAGSEPSKSAVVILTDAFGFDIPNPSLMADELAQRLNTDVWVANIFADGVPIFPGDAIEPGRPLFPEHAGQGFSVWMMARLAKKILPRIFILLRNRAPYSDNRAIKLINQIKAEHKYEKIGIAGYCFGGSMCIRLGATDLVDSAFIAHPGGFKIEELEALKVPTAWAFAEEDIGISKELVEKTKVHFKSQEGKASALTYDIEVYPGTTHGFAARPNFEYPKVVEGYKNALTQAVEWFKKTL